MSPLWVRRWESDAIPVTESPADPDDNDWIELENGIEIQFQSSSNATETDPPPHQYRTGDYWLIPARVATGKIEWPEDEKSQPIEQPPHGVQHHYAPLAVIGGDPDLRCKFEQLAKLSDSL